MAVFQRRTIERFKTLGERLRKVREESGYSLEEVERAIQIRRVYLEALETGQYTQLPGSLYIEQYLKRYAEFLKVDSAYVLDLYREREKRVVAPMERHRFEPQQASMPKEFVTPRIIRRLLIIVVVVIAFAYLIYTVVTVFSPPPLTITSPDTNVVVTAPTITVSGVTEPETTVTINGREVFLDTGGVFEETITLTEGINQIKITSAKKRSKPTQVIRIIKLEAASQE
ncbi:MAG: helix-turn-helix domain-containing protein [Candidatus Kerfeldbacteria bacterium]|nr:helix-turn-helix domain-containing protein [Candidatus Kerfeldbacteria bacterium]